MKHLSTVWSWHSVLPYSMLCYNGYSSPNLNGYSPYELVFGHKMTLSHELEIKVDTVANLLGVCLDSVCNMGFLIIFSGDDFPVTLGNLDFD